MYGGRLEFPTMLCKANVLGIKKLANKVDIVLLPSSRENVDEQNLEDKINGFRIVQWSVAMEEHL